MNFDSRLKKLESKAARSDACNCKASVHFQRTALGEQRQTDSAPENCQRCGKPVGEAIVKIIVPAKMTFEGWKASSNK